MPLRETLNQFTKDSRFVLVVLLLSLPLGYLVNQIGPQPLPLRPLPADQALVQNLGASSLPQDLSPTKIDIDWAMLELESGKALFVDARESSFFDLGHIPGAVNLPRSTFQQDYDKFQQRVPKDRLLIVYCSESSCVDSSVVAKALSRLGYSNVQIYQGGWEEWEAAELPREP